MAIAEYVGADGALVRLATVSIWRSPRLINNPITVLPPAAASALLQGEATFEVCGSPDEVANDPSKGSRYHQFINSAAYYPYTDGLDYDMIPNNAKDSLHNTIVVTAEDQLRQRAAWALAQVNS